MSSIEPATLERASRRRTALVLIAIGLILVSGFAGLTVGRHHSLRPPTTGSPPAIPHGMQPISFHGMQLFVPASWPKHNTDCGIPISDTAIIEIGFEETCYFSPHPRGLTVLRLTTSDTPEGRARAMVATDPVVVDGRPARRGVGVPPGEVTRLDVLVVPTVGVVASVEAPDLRISHRILDTARVVPIDSYGCTDKVTSLRPSAPSRRTGAERELVPGDPSTAAICFYTGNWLGGSVRLSETQMRELGRTLNALPQGVSFPGSGSPDRPAECLADSQRGYIARFGFRSGPDLDVYIHISGCNGLSASNGPRTTKIDAHLVTLLSIAGYDGSFPDPTKLQ